MDGTASTGGAATGARRGGLLFVVVASLIAFLGLAPWLMAAMFAPALLGAPGPSPAPLTILGVAAVLSYPLWLFFWASRVIAERRSGLSGRLPAAIMAVPGLLLIGAFSFINGAP